MCMTFLNNVDEHDGHVIRECIRRGEHPLLLFWGYGALWFIYG